MLFWLNFKRRKLYTEIFWNPLTNTKIYCILLIKSCETSDVPYTYRYTISNSVYITKTELGIKCLLVYLQFHGFCSLIPNQVLKLLVYYFIPQLWLLNLFVSTTLQERMAPGIPVSEHMPQHWKVRWPLRVAMLHSLCSITDV